VRPRACRNATPALGALATLRTPARRGRGDAHGQPTPGATWGIDPGLRRVASGEVTVQGLVGGAQARLDALGEHGDGAGGVGC
jgi:hypothetical protein